MEILFWHGLINQAEERSQLSRCDISKEVKIAGARKWAFLLIKLAPFRPHRSRPGHVSPLHARFPSVCALLACCSHSSLTNLLISVFIIYAPQVYSFLLPNRRFHARNPFSNQRAIHPNNGLSDLDTFPIRTIFLQGGHWYSTEAYSLNSSTFSRQ